VIRIKCATTFCDENNDDAYLQRDTWNMEQPPRRTADFNSVHRDVMRLCSLPVAASAKFHPDPI